MPTRAGPYPSKVDASYCSPSRWPVPRRMARSTFSPDMFAAFAARIAVRRRGLEFGSPPPMRAAMLISRMIRVNTRPRFASVAPFLCLIVAHFECPDMTHPRLFRVTAAWPRSSMEEFLRRRAVSENAGRLAAALYSGRVAAKHLANRGTVAKKVGRLTAAKKVGRLTAAKKNNTNAETYGEPQTPAEPR